MASQKLSQLTSKTTLIAADSLYALDSAAPAASQSKRILVSDIQRNFGPNYLLTPPVDAQFSWVNQGGASVVSGDYGIALRVPAGATRSLRIRDKAAPATPYTITAGFTWAFGTETSTGDADIGIGWRNAGTGNIAGLELATFSNAVEGMISRKFTSPTVFSADYAGSKNLRFFGPILWFRMRDDGTTNRILSFSADGVNFVTFHTVGRTDFLTPDRVCFYFSAVNGANAIDGIMTLVSWKEEA